MPRILKNIAILLLASSLVNCSDDETYDKSKAVAAFADLDALSIDESLKNVEIKIPAQKNQAAENFYFKPTSDKKFLTKSSKTWSGRKPFYKNRFVFEPIIADDKIFSLNASGILYSYDLKTKKRLWKKRIFARKYLKDYQNPKIGYFDNVIFAIAGNNKIKAVSAINGEIIWEKKILSLPISKPISDGENLYVITNDDKTYALNAKNGELIWISSGVAKPTTIFGSANPVIYKSEVIVAYASGEVYALDKKNGEQNWSQNLNINKAVSSDFYLNDIDATPIIKNNTVFVIGNGGLMMAINLENGDYLWKVEIASIADFWAAGNYLFAIDKDDKLVAINQENGAIKYISQLPHYKNEKKPASKIIYNGVIMAGDKLIICDTRGRLLIANPNDGKIEQIFKIGKKIHHSPIVIDGKIYLYGLGMFSVSLIELY